MKQIYSLFHGKNEIYILVQVKKDDINKEIYFLNNTYDIKEELKELNELNTELYIDGKLNKYNKYFIPDKKENIILN